MGIMGILLTNGDSFTYGDELEGSRSPNGIDTHHRHTYTHKLSERLHLPYVNLAENGSSNAKIYRRTLDFLMRPSDHVDMVVIMWSNWGRFELCESEHFLADKDIHIPQECNMNQIIPSHKSTSFELQWGDSTNKNRKEILKAYTEDVLTMQTQILYGLKCMQQMQFICEMMMIPIIQGVIHGDMYKNILATLKMDGFEDYKKEVTKILKDLRPECKMGLGNYTDLYTLAEKSYTLKPMGHADEDTHTEYAKLIAHIITAAEMLPCY